MKAFKKMFSGKGDNAGESVYSPQNKKLAKTLARYLKNAPLIAGGVASIFAPGLLFADDQVRTGVPNDGYVDIVITDFEDGSFYQMNNYDTEGLSKTLPAMIISRLQGNDKIRVLSKRSLSSMLREHGLTLQDFDEDPYFCLDKIEGIDGILTGTYSLLHDGRRPYIRVDSRYIDKDSALVEETQTVEGGLHSIALIVNDLVEELEDDLEYHP